MFVKGLQSSTNAINADNMQLNTKFSGHLRLSEEIPLSTRFENKSINIELTNDNDVNSKISLTFTPIEEDNSNDTQTIKAKVIKCSGTKSFTQELELVKVDKDITIGEFIEDYQILKIFEIKLVKLNDGTKIVVPDKSSSDINELQNISNEKNKKIDQLELRLSKLESKYKEVDPLVFVKLFQATEILKNRKEKLKNNVKQIEKTKYCDCEKDSLTFLNVEKDINRNTSDSDIEIVKHEGSKINLYKNPQNKTELELANHKYIILEELCKFNTDKYSNSEQISAHMNKARKTLFNLTEFRIDPLPFSVPAVEAFSKICAESYRICKERTDFECGNYQKRCKEMERLIEFVTTFELDCDLSDDLTEELSANKEKLSIKLNVDSKDLVNYQLIDTQFPIYNHPNNVNVIPDNSSPIKNTDDCVEFFKVEEFKEDIENCYLTQNNKKEEVALQKSIATLKEKSANCLAVNKKEIKVGELFKSLEQEFQEFDDDADTESENTESENQEPVNNLTSNFKFYSSSSSSSESEFEEFEFPEQDTVYIRISKNELKCIKCDKISSTVWGVTAHYKTHLESSTLCHKCGLIFETRAKINNHYSSCSKEFNKHGEKIEKRGANRKDENLKPCPYKNCSSMLHDDYRYYEHQNTHTGDKPYKCSCGKTFNKSFNFYAHFNRPSNKNEKNCFMENCILPHYAPAGNYTFMENFRCGFEDCCKSFPSKFKLLEHAYVHTGEKLYYCSCGLNYKYFINLKSHMKNSKCSPIGCIYPDYVDPRSLAGQVRRGRKRKIIKEIDLNENSPSLSNIENKIAKRTRTKNVDLYCSICNIKFPSYISYRHHKTKHAERKYACQECKRAFPTLGILNEHTKIHLVQLTCKICNKLFRKRSSYKIHLERHKNKGENPVTERKRSSKVIIHIYDCKICFNQFKCSKEFIEHFSDNKHKSKEFDWLKTSKISKMSCHICSDVSFANFYQACQHYEDLHRLLRNVFKYIYKENGIKDEYACVTKNYKRHDRNKTKNISDDATLSKFQSKDCISSTENKEEKRDLVNYQCVDIQFPIYRKPVKFNITDTTNPANLKVDVEFVKVEEFKDDIENDYLPENNIEEEIPLQQSFTTLKGKSTDNFDVFRKEIKVDELFKPLGQKLQEFNDDTEPQNTESENIEPLKTEPVNNSISYFKFYSSSSSSSSESEFEELKFPKKEQVYIKISNNEFKCIKCDKTCLNALGVIAHYNGHLEISTLCHKCGVIFETRAKLNNHYTACLKNFYKNSETSEIPVAVRRNLKDRNSKPCPYKNCGCILHDDYRYYEHQNFHTGEEPYKCSCGKTFSKSFNFYAHFNRPSNENGKNCIMDNCILPHYAPAGNYTLMENFRCGFEDCCKSFDSRVKLLEHTYSHTGEKLYYCSCGINYRYLTSLTSHIKNSKCSPIGCIYPDYVDPKALTGEVGRGRKRKIIKEIDLNENSPSLSNIENKTEKRPRTKNVNLYCSICNIKFPSYLSYRHHKTKHAERKYACQECKRAFQTLGKLNQHIKIHLQMTCRICNKFFYKRSSYKLHLERHKNKGEKAKRKRTSNVITYIHFCEICSNEFECSKEFSEHFSDKKHKTKEIDWLKNSKITKMSCHLCSDVTFANFYEACQHYGYFHRLLRNVFKYIYKENDIKDETTCITKSYRKRDINKTKNINEDATLSQFDSKDCTTSTISKKYPFLFENCDVDDILDFEDDEYGNNETEDNYVMELD